MEEMDPEQAVPSSTSSSGTDDEEENAMERRAVELEGQVSANPYLYDAHVELTELYRKLGVLVSMRAAYERFSGAYPLTVRIWLQWIRDEIRLAGSAAEKKAVLELFKKGVRDYHSMQLWREYCQYAIKLGAVALTASEQSVRNCSWAAELWDLRLKVLEIIDAPEGEVLACFEESLRCVGGDRHLEPWRAYVEHTRRRNDDEKLWEIFSKARDRLGFDTEQLTKLMKIQANLTAKTDYAASRDIWKEIMQLHKSEQEFGKPMDAVRRYGKTVRYDAKR